MSNEIELLCHAFDSSLSNDRETRQKAEKYIQDLSETPNYISQLLFIISSPETAKFKLSACVALKNNLKTDDLVDELKIKHIEDIYKTINNADPNDRSTIKILFKIISQLSMNMAIHTTNIINLIIEQLKQRDNLFAIYCAVNFVKSVSSTLSSFIKNEEASTHILTLILGACSDLLNSGIKNEMIYKTVNNALKIYLTKTLTQYQNNKALPESSDSWMNFISLLMTNKFERTDSKNEWQFHQTCLYILENLFRNVHRVEEGDDKKFAEYFKKKWANHFGAILLNMLKACVEGSINPTIHIQALALEILEIGLYFSDFYKEIIKPNFTYLVEKICVYLMTNINSHFEEAEDFSQMCVLQSEYYTNEIEPRCQVVSFLGQITKYRAAHTFPIYLQFIEKQFLLLEQTQPTNEQEKEQHNKQLEVTMAMLSAVAPKVSKKMNCVQILERFVVPWLNSEEMILKLRAHFTISVFWTHINDPHFLIKCYTHLTHMLTPEKNSNFFIISQCLASYIDHTDEQLHAHVAQSIPLILDAIILSTEGEYELEFEDLFAILVENYQDEIKPFVDKTSFALATLLRSLGNGLKQTNEKVLDLDDREFYDTIRISTFIDSAIMMMKGYTSHPEILQKMNIILPVFLEWPIYSQMKCFDEIMKFVIAYTYHTQTIPIEVWSYLQLIKNVYEMFTEDDRPDCFSEICPFLKNLINKDEHTFVKMCNEQNSIIRFFIEEARKFCTQTEQPLMIGLDIYIVLLEASMNSKILKDLIPIILTILLENKFYFTTPTIGPIIIALCVTYDIETTMNFLESHNCTHTFIQHAYKDHNPFRKIQSLVRYYVVSSTLIYRYISTYPENSLLQQPTLTNMLHTMVINCTKLSLILHTHKETLNDLENTENNQEDEGVLSSESEHDIDENEDAPNTHTHLYKLSNFTHKFEGENLEDYLSDEDDDDYDFQSEISFDSDIISDISAHQDDKIVCYYPTPWTIKTLSNIDVCNLWKTQLTTFPKEIIQSLHTHFTPQELHFFGQ